MGRLAGSGDHFYDVVALTGGVLPSEFHPARDRNDQSLRTLAWLLEYLLLRRYG
jgi:hypothetical protein